MADSCGYVNQFGVKCGRRPHPDDPSAHSVTDPILTVPKPFCVVATDPFALAVIRCWISAAHAQGVNQDKINRAEQHFKEIRDWQLANGTRLPD